MELGATLFWDFCKQTADFTYSPSSSLSSTLEEQKPQITCGDRRHRSMGSYLKYQHSVDCNNSITFLAFHGKKV